MREPNKSQVCTPRCVQNFSNPGQCPTSTTLAGLPPPRSVPASFSDSFMYSLVHAVSIAGTHNVPCLLPSPGMWRWGSPWSQGPLYSFYSSVTVSPPGSEGSSLLFKTEHCSIVCKTTFCVSIHLSTDTWVPPMF